jgi:molybdenum cofactor cytidylyltransferase
MPTNSPASSCTGLLLAAGSGSRFDPAGVQDKLLQRLPDGRSIATASASNLIAALSRVVAVVRPGATALAQELASIGCEVIVCDDAATGMASSLVRGLTHTIDSQGWVIALADMPLVQPDTIAALATAVTHGADIAVPTYHGLHGNPVGFARTHLAYLLKLTGDAGARSLLQKFFVTEVVVEDAGVRRDIDTPADLQRITA